MGSDRFSLTSLGQCGFCGKAMNVSFDTSFKPKPYTADEASSQNFAKVAQFECRGCELVEFLPLQVSDDVAAHPSRLTEPEQMALPGHDRRHVRRHLARGLDRL